MGLVIIHGGGKRHEDCAHPGSRSQPRTDPRSIQPPGSQPAGGGPTDGAHSPALGRIFNLFARGLVLLDRSLFILHGRVLRSWHVLDRPRQHDRVSARIDHRREVHQQL